MKYIIQCRSCGGILFKTQQPFVATLQIEIKCPVCKKILKMPEDIIVNQDRERKPGLESGR